MSKKICPECGYPVTGDMARCPECGFVLESQDEKPEDVSATSSNEHPQQTTATDEASTSTPIVGKMTHCPDCGADISIRAYRCPRCGSMILPDFGNLIYESFWKKYATFTGRSRRAEYFSFLSVFVFLCATAWEGERTALIFILPVILPMITVSVRRLHEIGRSGWWVIAPFFFYFKDSDESENEYGKSPKYQQ